MTHKREFDAVFAGKARKSPQQVGGSPFTVFAVPNTLGHCRLGLSVGRRIGNAPQRNTFKRRVREAFRLTRSKWDRDQGSVGLDLVVNALPHTPRSTQTYAEMLTWCVNELRALHAKRAARSNRPSATSTGEPDGPNPDGD